MPSQSGWKPLESASDTGEKRRRIPEVFRQTKREDRMAFQHTSVLLKETVDNLRIKPDGVYVDATLGGGGHAFAVCEHLNDQGRFIGIDQDAAAIAAAGERLRGFGEKVTMIRSNYCEMKLRLEEIGIERVDAREKLRA